MRNVYEYEFENLKRTLDMDGITTLKPGVKKSVLDDVNWIQPALAGFSGGLS
jgi:hypothetical protein